MLSITDARCTLDRWIALALTSLLLCIMANVCTLVQCSFRGQVHLVTLWDAICQLFAEKNGLLAMLGICMAYVIVIMPILQSMALLLALLPQRFSWLKKRWGASVSYMRYLRWVQPLWQHLHLWSMVDVLLLSVLVACIKLSEMLLITPGPALLSLASLAIVQSVWGITGSKALNSALEGVKSSHTQLRSADTKQNLYPLSTPYQDTAGPIALLSYRRVALRDLQRIWALWLSALFLYVPAMCLPMVHTRSFMASGDSTLLEGIVHFWTTGSKGLAVLIMVASVLIPLFKLMVLGILLWSVQRGECKRPHQYMRLFQWIQVLGRWSMLDIFVVAMTMALMHFYAFAKITAGVGIIAFAGVVICTLHATHRFDARWIWQQKGMETS
jgi:paraquat-inducible protein A